MDDSQVVFTEGQVRSIFNKGYISKESYSLAPDSDILLSVYDVEIACNKAGLTVQERVLADLMMKGKGQPSEAAQVLNVSSRSVFRMKDEIVKKVTDYLNGVR
jgi:hypothetical protein